MKLTDVLLECSVNVNEEFSTKQEVLERVAALTVATKAGGELSKDDVLEALLERERMCTTGFGNGLAVPHCRIDALNEFIAGAITIPAGVEFEALDNKPVKLVFFLIGPEESKSDHVHLLSAIAQLCKDDDKRNKLTEASSPSEFYDLVSCKPAQERNLVTKNPKEIMQVFIHTTEDIYLEILEIFASLDDASVSIVNTERCSGSLMNEPIFLGLMGNSQLRSGWIIFSVVPKAMSNEIIRRIEDITGPLGKDHDVMVTIQDLIYSKGSLNL